MRAKEMMETDAMETEVVEVAWTRRGGRSGAVAAETAGAVN